MRSTYKRRIAVSFTIQLIWLSLFTATCPAAAAWSLSGHRSGRMHVQKSQTTVRGKLIRKIKGGVRPAASVALTLSIPNTDRRSVPVYSDTEGMYYIDITPGKYVLEIWGSQKEIIKSFNIDVPAVQIFDVAPIEIP